MFPLSSSITGMSTTRMSPRDRTAGGMAPEHDRITSLIPRLGALTNVSGGGGGGDNEVDLSDRGKHRTVHSSNGNDCFALLLPRCVRISSLLFQ